MSNNKSAPLYRLDYQGGQYVIKEWDNPPYSLHLGVNNLWGTTPNEAIDLFLALRRRQIASLEAEMVQVEALRQ